jgi:predicted esterase YcpF (UPF0227 family)
MIIYYLHGFNSGFNPDAQKVKSLEKLGIVKGVTVNYLIPSEVEALKHSIEADAKLDEVVLVGTSLGGYFARYIGAELKLRTILLNPSLNPYTSLLNYAGWPVKNFLTKESFMVEADAVAYLKKYEVLADAPDTLLVLATDDEVIDYQLAYKKLDGSCKIVLTTGGHRLEDVNKMLEHIEHFINTLPAHGNIQDLSS